MGTIDSRGRHPIYVTYLAVIEKFVGRSNDGGVGEVAETKVLCEHINE